VALPEGTWTQWETSRPTTQLERSNSSTVEISRHGQPETMA